MPSISLIANSGIQFYKFDVEINPNNPVINTMGFAEIFDLKTYTKIFDSAYYFSEDDLWFSKRLLKDEGYIDDADQIIEEVVGSGFNRDVFRSHALKEEEEYFTKSDIKEAIEVFTSKRGKNVWIPLPYFRKEKDTFYDSPIAWARGMIKNISIKGEKVLRYRIILAFDTKLEEKEQNGLCPVRQDFINDEMVLALSSNEDFNLQYCDFNKKGRWVDKYLRKVYFDYLGLTEQERMDRKPDETSRYFEYLGFYLYMIKYFANMGNFPEVKLYSDLRESIDIDLVLDIGNSNTCGLLFESPTNKGEKFEFKKVKKLKLRDLSDPEHEYEDPFSMRFAFVKTNFGEFTYDLGSQTLSLEQFPFRWLSFVRLGKEANRLISTHSIHDEGKETTTHHSSPKRYLWDTKNLSTAWAYINQSEEDKNIQLSGVTDHINLQGYYEKDMGNQAQPNYPRRTLMTFVYNEILLHTISQINSYEFRKAHGDERVPRKLKRITITCPTSIVQYEQIALRQCAADAVRILNLHFPESILGRYENETQRPSLEIVPNPKDLSKKLDQINNRKDWIYDEATCGQFVFLYAEIAKRYQNKAEVFFNLYGRKRDDVDDQSKKALTIGSIDIGGGTTDLMICAYEYKDIQGRADILPQPLYWDSFNLAGDDLLKNIVQLIILEGKPQNAEERGYTGVIENVVREKWGNETANKMLHFFGTDTARQTYMDRIFRKNFVVQVAIPIAMQYLQHAIADQPDQEVGFEDLFREVQPNAEILAHFKKQFGVDFKSIRWKLSKKRVFDIVELTFDPLLRAISALLSAYGCDFLLLAGKPTTIPKIRELFVKYYPVSPDRIVTLMDYRVGRWYPFATETGYFQDPKSIVAVGALIGLMGGNLGKLGDFELDVRELKKKLVATANFMGGFQEDGYIREIYLSPDSNSCEIEVPKSLPRLIGYKQLPNKKYLGRPIYKLDFNEAEIRNKVLQQSPELANQELAIIDAIESYKDKLKQKMPFRAILKRSWSQSREEILIDNIQDVSRNQISKSILSLSVMTLADEKGYWLDTGEFVLNIK